MPWQAIADRIAEASSRPFQLADRQAAAGGCINRSFVLRGRDGRRFFVKLNGAERLPMFEAEADGLSALHAAGTLAVPRPVCTGMSDAEAFLVMDYLDLGGGGDEAALGRGLAAMHGQPQTSFGWRRDNTIGDTPQPNAWHADWIAFWRDNRLGYQLELCRRRCGAASLLRKGESLMARLEGFFPGYCPVPSLLHGDLWGGNVGYVGGRPVIFDPAVYCGDRETDLAMTELFGGFSPTFQAAYREVWPLDPGYATRKSLYNIYHVLNHDHMFGGGYARQAEAMMDRLLAASR